VANLRQHMHFLYLQDDFRVNDKLTLNLGLRYEYATPWWEKDNIMSNFDPARARWCSPRTARSRTARLIKPDRNNFGPRLGFAYTLTPADRLRGGYGISYVHFHRAGGANVLPINGPQVINAVVVQTPAQPGFRPTQDGYPEGFTDPSQFNPLAANITYMPEDYRSSRVQSWFVRCSARSRERSRGRRLRRQPSDGLLLFANFNQALPNNSAGTIPLQQRRPIPEFADITYSFNGGKSRYNALQLKYEYRMRRGVMLLSSFTWSKAKDNGSGSLEGQAQGPQNFYDLEDSYGTSFYDQPYNSTTSFVWTLPVRRGERWLGDANAFVDALLGGWTVSGINTMTSGEAVSLTYSPAAAFQVSGITQDFRGANFYRANLNGDPYGDKKSVTNYLSRDTVTVPTDPSQPFGNSPRNVVRGPSYWQVDFVASKDFRMPVRQPDAAQFRFEAFNLFNHTNFRSPNANRNSANYGTITQTFDARQMQLGVKLTF
jgi:hypothetical protein